MLKIVYGLTFMGLMGLVSCVSNKAVEEADCTVSALSVSVVSTKDSGCDPSGSLTVAATGGEGPVSYSIDGAGFQSSPVFENLPGAAYTVTARDGRGCEATVSARIGAGESGIAVTASVTNASCGEADGTISVTATGGDGLYQYRLDGGGFGESALLENVSAGIHTITVLDGEGCTSGATVQVLTNVSFQTDILPIVNTYCVIDGCHKADRESGAPDFRNRDTILKNASKIRTNVVEKDMPPPLSDKPFLSEEQIRLIACWVDDGARDN